MSRKVTLYSLYFMAKRFFQASVLQRNTRCKAKVAVLFQTSLLCRLQAQSLPDEAPPIDKFHSFSKITVTFELLMGF